MKYQAKIHKLWGAKLDGDSKSKSVEAYKKAIEQFPQLKGVVSPQQFRSSDVTALCGDNISICKYYCMSNEDTANELEKDFPENLPRTLIQTVRANIIAYNNVMDNAERDTDKYRPLYKNIAKAYDKYFAQAAEDVLEGVFGEQYTNFVAEQTKKIEAEMKAAAAKRKATNAAKNAQ